MFNTHEFSFQTYTFSGLEPYTEYIVKVYIREKNTSKIFPPSKTKIIHTEQGSKFILFVGDCKSLYLGTAVVLWMDALVLLVVREIIVILTSSVFSPQCGNSDVSITVLDWNFSFLYLSMPVTIYQAG